MQLVVASASQKYVSARAAKQDVITGSANQAVLATPAAQQVIAVAAIKGVVARANAAVQDVVAVITTDVVVRVGAAGDVVLKFVAPQVGVEGRAGVGQPFHIAHQKGTGSGAVDRVVAFAGQLPGAPARELRQLEASVAMIADDECVVAGAAVHADQVALDLDQAVVAVAADQCVLVEAVVGTGFAGVCGCTRHQGVVAVAAVEVVVFVRPNDHVVQAIAFDPNIFVGGVTPQMDGRTAKRGQVLHIVGNLVGRHFIEERRTEFDQVNARVAIFNDLRHHVIDQDGLGHFRDDVGVVAGAAVQLGCPQPTAVA